MEWTGVKSMALDGKSSIKRLVPREPKYVEVADTTLRLHVAKMFAEEFIQGMSVSALVMMPDGKWLVKLSPDFLRPVLEEVQGGPVRNAS